ncbi:MAG TPA: glycosyltransferase family 2 protein [Steroidobacteraceae bacterium]|jgi:glycosyltransferase involved in cell wall biosynthesis
MKVSIIIPVYNEARTLRTLLARVKSQAIPGAGKEIIIIESGSTDGSREIVEEFLALNAGDDSVSLRALHEKEPKGKGHAVRQGFGLATGDILMIQDADLEYDTADYPRLLGPVLQGHTAFVMGSRHLGPERWNIRKFSQSGLRSAWMNLGGALFHGFFNVLFATHLSDPTSMHKVFRADCLEGLRFSCNRFDFDFELLGKLLRRGFVPFEVPVSYTSRGFDEGKKIHMLRDPPTWVWAILKSRFVSLGSEAPPIKRCAGKRRYSKKPAIRPSL